MPSAGFFIFALSRKTVGELAGIVSEQFADLDRAGSVHLGQKIDATAFGSIGLDFDENPARSALMATNR